MKSQIKAILHALPFKQHLFEALRSMPVPRKIYQHLYFSGVVKIQIQNANFKIMHYQYQDENDLFWGGVDGFRESMSLRIWLELSKRAKVALDIGAHTGIFALAAKAANPNLRSIGFEPFSGMYDKFATNVSLNKFHIEVEKIALSNQGGHATLFVPVGDHPYCASLNLDYQNLGQNLLKEVVAVSRLDEYIAKKNLETVDLMKVDVESFEPEVLEGMGDCLARFKPTIIAEVLSGDCANRLQKILDPIGYLYFDIDEVSKPKLNPKISVSSRYNYLICMPEVAKQLNLI